MASVSAHAIAARLRAGAASTPATPFMLIRGGRIAAVLFGGSAMVALLLQLASAAVGPALADPLALPAAASVPAPVATWAFVLYESSLLPHTLPGTPWWTWGAGCLALTATLLVLAFRDGRDHALRAGHVVLLAAPALVPALLVGAAEGMAGGGWTQLPLALLVPLPILAAAAAGRTWRRLRDHRDAAPVLRALLAAAFALPLAVVVAAPAVLLAPAGSQPGGMWMATLLPYVPNAVLRGALDGYGPANSAALALMVAAAVIVGIQLNRRSIAERAAYAGAVAGLLALAAAAATPMGSGGAAWHVAEQALPAALLVGILGAALGPYLGLLGAGHWLASTAVLRALGDRLPPPAAAEITDLGALPIATPPALPAPRRVRERRVPSISPHHAGRIAVGAAAALSALLAVTVAFTVLFSGAPNDTVPELGAAQAYLQATGAGDAGRAWAATSVDTSALPADAQPRLLTRDDLARMLALPGGHRGAPLGLRLDVAGRAGGATLVRARYTDSGGAHDETLRVVRTTAGYRVQLVPAGLALPASGVARVTVDGASLNPGPAPVAVLPGLHEVSAEYPAPFVGQKALVTADRPYAEPAVAPVGARLDDSAMAAARVAVAAALRTCLAATSAHPTGCPQTIDAPAGTSVRWSLVGDAAQSLVVLPDDRGGAVAHGQFEAIGAYDVHVPEDVKHVASGGSFRAPLSWTAGHFSVAGSVDPDTAEVGRPAVTGADLMAAVRAGFQRCTATALLRPADCPQSEPSQYFVKDVSWRLTSDPVAGASTGFDARHGILTVAGAYAMAVSYVEGGEAKQAQSSGGYRADLFWDGRQLVLVAISRA